jgi:hypothetical protein
MIICLESVANHSHRRVPAATLIRRFKVCTLLFNDHCARRFIAQSRSLRLHEDLWSSRPTQQSRHHTRKFLYPVIQVKQSDIWFSYTVLPTRTCKKSLRGTQTFRSTTCHLQNTGVDLSTPTHTHYVDTRGRNAHKRLPTYGGRPQCIGAIGRVHWRCEGGTSAKHTTLLHCDEVGRFTSSDMSAMSFELLSCVVGLWRGLVSHSWSWNVVFWWPWILAPILATFDWTIAQMQPRMVRHRSGEDMWVGGRTLALPW